MNQMIAHLQRQFRYDDWANRETAASIERSSPRPEIAVHLLAHIVGAQSVWLDRLHGRPPSIEVWPRIELVDVPAHLNLLRDSWAVFLEGADLDAPVAYQNSKGQRFTSSVLDILAHVVNHGTYHRGQIASVVRAAGSEPAYTDWIHAARQGHIQKKSEE